MPGGRRRARRSTGRADVDGTSGGLESRAGRHGSGVSGMTVEGVARDHTSATASLPYTDRYRFVPPSRGTIRAGGGGGRFVRRRQRVSRDRSPTRGTNERAG